MLKTFSATLIIALAGANILSAATYYVAKTGSDSNAGTQAAPFLTISKSASKAVAGDTVIISAGTYSESVNFTASGNSLSPISFTGQGAVTLGGVKVRANYVNLTGLTFSAAQPMNSMYLVDLGAYNSSGSANNVTLSNCTLDLASATGLGMATSGNFNRLIGVTFQNGVDLNGPPTQYIGLWGNSNTIYQCFANGGNDMDFAKVFGVGNNIISNEVTGLLNNNYATSEHADFVQMFGSGSFVTVAGNYVHDCASMQVINTEYDISGAGTGSSAATHDLYIYNNVFANIGSAGFSGIANTYIFNNVFYKVATYQDGPLFFYSDGSTRTSAGSQVVNNVFLQCGSNPSSTSMGCIISDGANLSSMNISYNYFGGTSFAAKSTAAGAYIGTKTVNGGDPKFSNIAGYDFHLLAGSPLIGFGTNISSFFTADKDGNVRPASSAWDIGAFEYGATGGGTNGVPPTVSAVTQSASDVDPVTAGVQVYEGTSVQYSGSGSVPNGHGMNWAWSYSVNGGASTSFQNGSGTTVPGVSFTYVTGTAGNTYVWTLTVTDTTTLLTAQSSLTMSVEAPPVAGTNLTFLASAGTITAPFVLSGGYISQPVQTTVVSQAGQATYNFSVTNAGNYVIQALVNAPSDSANSFYVNIDGLPVDPTMCWDIPITSGFEQRIVSWRGNGTDTNNQFVPEVFNLAAGAHQVVFAGREAGTQLQSFSILQLLSAPQNLHVLPTVVTSPTFSAGGQ